MKLTISSSVDFKNELKLASVPPCVLTACRRTNLPYLFYFLPPPLSLSFRGRQGVIPWKRNQIFISFVIFNLRCGRVAE